MEEKQQDHLSDMGLQIDGEVRQQFSVAGKWAKFISILIFICSGILLIAGFAGGGDIIREFKNISPAYQSFSELEGGILIGIIVFIVLVLVIVGFIIFLRKKCHQISCIIFFLISQLKLKEHFFLKTAVN